MYHNSLNTVNRRDFLKLGLASAAALALPGRIYSQDDPPIEQGPYRPLYWHSVGGSGTICLENLSYFYPGRNNIALPVTVRPGSRPGCTVLQSALNGAQGFAQTGNNPILLSPSNMTRVAVGVAAATVPHDPAIAWEQWRDYAAQPDIDPATRRMTILGDWNIPVVTGQAQGPDSPVNWSEWRNLETANEIKNIVEERGSEVPITLHLNPGLHELWKYPDKTIPGNDGKVLAELCPASAGVPEYEVEVLVMFPFVDVRTSPPEVGIWALVQHVDPRITSICTEQQLIHYNYVEQHTVLETVLHPVRLAAQLRAFEKTRIWPISNMEFVPVAGGPSLETLGNVALIVVGALLLIAVIALIVGAPQIIIVAAVAAA